MSEKPDWFKLSDEESAKPSAPKSKKRLIKIALITAPLLLIGGALVFADGGGEDDAPNLPADTAMTIDNSNGSQNSNGASDSTKGSVKRNSLATGVPMPKGGGEGGEGHEGGEDD